MKMNLITREELRIRLERGDELKLVMTMPEHAFRAKRIPRSLHAAGVEEALERCDPTEEIVVYCSDVSCAASIYAYWALERRGYARVRRYAGGIADWEAAGYPLESGHPADAGRAASSVPPTAPARVRRVRTFRARPWLVAA